MSENKNEKTEKNQFAVMEEEVLDFWDRAKTFEKSVEKDAPEGDYVFYDGPPFITGMPHYATLLPSIAKDVVPRYWTMKGYRVERVWGWDCHGLPAENKVEKELNLRNKKDIEALGVGKFIDACRNYVQTGSEQWRWYIDRIGRWVDMDHAYKTMDLDFMESVIWAFKELHNKGLIYEGYRSSLHCPRCATPLSKFEITMDAGSYKDVTDESVVVKFKTIEPLPHPLAVSDSNLYLLVWTTTPWTLPGNFALAVGEDIEYAKVKFENDYYVLAKDRVAEIFIDKEYKIIETFKGIDWFNSVKYEPVFKLKRNISETNDKAFAVYSAKFVSTEEGTGIVHIAPNFGEDDFNLGKEVGLPMLELMDENGIYTDEAGEWSGQYFKKANTKALEELGDKLFLKFPYTHSYPFCYRCSTPLIYKTQKAWYLKIEEVRQKMIDTNKKVNWVPEFFREGRFQYNLENAPDWCLSRSRYWGSPIPVWKCETCGELKVVGSLAEIEKESGVKIEDLHKPGIDEIKFKCTCGGEMKRVPEVLDCWFESGSMPFAQFHYPFKRKDEWKNIFPADFIIEYTGQLRGWFYYLHVLSNALFDSLCFKNVIVTGVLAGTDGRKMSKSFGNYPDPKTTLDKYGSDSLRMYFMGSPIMTGGDMNMNERDIQDSLRKNVILVWNVVKFYELFATSGENITRDLESAPASDNVLDKWIMARFGQLHAEVTENLEKYNLPAASKPISSFIDDLSTWYLRRSRDRFKGDDEADKKAALETTGYVLLQLSKVMAPFMPFMAEQIWQKITGNNFSDDNKSVHLESWPGQLTISNSQLIIDEMEAVRKIVELGLAKRDEASVKVRQPLKKLKIENIKFIIKEEYLSLILDEINVKEIEQTTGDGELAVELDLEITEDLKLEGVKREIVRTINNMRKDAGLTIQDMVSLAWHSDNEEVKKAFELFCEDIKKDTLCKQAVASAEVPEGAKAVKINGAEISILIVR